MVMREIPLTEISRSPYNPRKRLAPGDPAYERIRASLDRWGLVEPLVWNERTGNLVGGHQRLSVLEDQGKATAQVAVVDLDEREEKALNLALNKVGGEWDEDRLAKILEELRMDDLDLYATGFSEEEIGDLLEPVKLKPIALNQAPPVMSWVLIGIPTVRFGEIAGSVERIGAVEGAIVETCVNDDIQENG